MTSFTDHLNFRYELNSDLIMYLDHWLFQSCFYINFTNAFIGCIVGEFIVRFIFLMRTLPGRKLKCRAVVKAFSDHRWGLLLPLFLVTMTGCVIWEKSQHEAWDENFAGINGSLLKKHGAYICMICLSWTLLRWGKCFQNSLDDIQTLEQNKASVAPGLAANYWFSFMEDILNGKVIQEHFPEYFKDTKERMKRKADEFSEQISNLSIFQKFIILLPSNCDNIITSDIHVTENVFTDVPGLSSHESHEIICQVSANSKKKLKIYWIFKNEDDEDEYHKSNILEKSRNSKPKIFVLVDFPQLLKSVMGPKKGWEEHERPGARRKNIKTFKRIVKNLIEGNFRQYRNDIEFLEFENSPDRKEKLSSILRKMIKAREDASYVSSSGSDSEA